MFGGFGTMEIILIFLVILLLFGAKRLPEIGSSLGRGIREFKGSLREIEGELKLPDDSQKTSSSGSSTSGSSTSGSSTSEDEKNGGESRRLTTSQ